MPTRTPDRGVSGRLEEHRALLQGASPRQATRRACPLRSTLAPGQIMSTSVTKAGMLSPPAPRQPCPSGHKSMTGSLMPIVCRKGPIVWGA